MIAIHWTLDGADEWIMSANALPDELTAYARTLVVTEAQAAAADIRARYPMHIADGVGVEPTSTGPYEAGQRVVSRSPLASIWENGSAIRHTARGYNRGAMPRLPQHVFFPRMIQARVNIDARLRDLLTSAGMTVIG